MSEFQAARDALLRAVRKVFPDAKPAPRWAGVEAWAAPRPEAVVDHDAPGTYDPKVTVVGIAERKSGPVVYFLDPGDYFVLETEKALLESARLKVGRGCIYHTRKAPLPTDALEELFRRVKARDARNAAARKSAGKRVAPTKEAPSKRAPGKPAAAEPPAAVEAYLAALPATQRDALERLRAQVLAAAPGATEKMSYGMPTFTHAGTNLVHMAAFRDHCSFFVGRAGVDELLGRERERYETTKSAIHFTPERPLPATLVKRIVKRRVAENVARAATRKRPAKKAAKKRQPR
jgi:uncharacterized protein YdhG (YjbR/CyaY superfamily)